MCMCTCVFLHGGMHITSETVRVCMSLLNGLSFACVSSMRIRRVSCGVCRRAKLKPFNKTQSEMGDGLLHKENGSLPLIIERVNFWRLWAKRSFPALAGVAVHLLCMHSA